MNYENPEYRDKYSICPCTGLRICEIEDLVFIREDGLSLMARERSKYKDLWIHRSPDKNGYSRITTKLLGTIKTHRAIYKAFAGDIKLNPNRDDLIVDHIDGNKSNNSINNLRLVTRGENRTNTKQHRNGKLSGAFLNLKNNKWVASIRINKHLYCLGSFTDEMSAHIKYCEALNDWNNEKKIPIKLSTLKNVKGYYIRTNNYSIARFVCNFKYKGLRHTSSFSTAEEAHNYYMLVRS